MRNTTKDNINEMKEIYVGKDCEKYKGILKLRYPFKAGVFQNQQDILTVFNHIYSKLEIKSEEIREHPIFITEPILNPYSNRKDIASVLFDNLNVPALFFGSQPILSLWASGDKSGVILESGEGITQCCSVYEGYSIPHSYMRQDFGGRNVTEYLQLLLRRVGHSLSTSTEMEIVKKIKEERCYNYHLNTSTDDSKKISDYVKEVHYTLPDENKITLKEEQVLAPEILFNPSIIGSEFMSFPEMVSFCVSKVDIDIRSNVMQHILLAGGNTLFKNLKERTGTEIKKLVKISKFKIHGPNSRKHSCWLGGSIITSLGSFNNMWVTRKDYLEKGDKELFIKTI